MILQYVITIVIASYLRKSLRHTHMYKQWNWILLAYMIVAIVLIVIPPSIPNTTVWCDAMGYILLGTILFLIFKKHFLKPYRFILLAVVPVSVISVFGFLLRHISPDLYAQWRSNISNLEGFAVLWLIGALIATNRQRKELEKSRKKVEEAQQNSAFLASMKAELEVQVQERTTELRRQKEELEEALTELRTTQAQLIQSEKMASLGELTAGIAHEIQNPLNFVNNFSDINTELIEEMEAEIAKGDMEEAVAIARDIRDNNQKIVHHGRRADSIVKGMLQHSRASSGQKEPTDINALADEYMRLAYHGLRAKDKTFNAELKTHFAENLPKISIVPQDIGRVLLNLFTNAFYAMQQKQKTVGSSFKPELQLTTSIGGDKLVIKVKDNGTGIPEEIQDKILQPFFTTKPSGQGTGLGLSLSYDIVVKGHGGSIDIESKEGEGATFIIRLPVSTS